MIRLKLLTVSEIVSRDADTNRICIINLMENLLSAGFPMLFPRLAILVALDRDSVADDPPTLSGTLEVRMETEVLFTGEVAVNFRDRTSTRHIMRLEGLVVKNPGRLNFEVKLGEAAASGSYSLLIEADKQPTLLTAADAPVEQPKQ